MLRLPNIFGKADFIEIIVTIFIVNESQKCFLKINEVE
jgi:hypothetical protein